MLIPEIESYVNNPDEVHVKFKITDKKYDIGLTSYGFHKTPPHYAYGPLIRDYVLLHFVVNGKGYVEANNTKYEITKGYCFSFFPGQIHHYISDEKDPWVYYYLGFDGGAAYELLNEFGFYTNKIAKVLININEITGIISELCKTSGEPVNHFFQMGCLYHIFHYLKENAAVGNLSQTREPQSEPVKNNNYIQMVSGIINHHYMKGIKVEALAIDLGISAGYLNSTFKEKFGKSIYQYLLERRIQVAKELLTITNKHIKQIAFEVGYNDPLYFSRIFRKHTGCIPSEYRLQTNAKIKYE